MVNLKKNTSSPEVRYILKLMSNDRLTIAEYFDGGFTEIVLDVCRGFYLDADQLQYDNLLMCYLSLH